MACKNRLCKHNSEYSANGCKLFPGSSWLRCRGASVRLVVAAKNTTKTKKMKGM